MRTVGAAIVLTEATPPAIRELAVLLPTVRVLAMTDTADPGASAAAISAGAAGVLERGADRRVARRRAPTGGCGRAGLAGVAPGRARALWSRRRIVGDNPRDRMRKLTRREREILSLLAQGPHHERHRAHAVDQRPHRAEPCEEPARQTRRAFEGRGDPVRLAIRRARDPGGGVVPVSGTHGSVRRRHADRGLVPSGDRRACPAGRRAGDLGRRRANRGLRGAISPPSSASRPTRWSCSTAKRTPRRSVRT